MVAASVWRRLRLWRKEWDRAGEEVRPRALLVCTCTAPSGRGSDCGAKGASERAKKCRDESRARHAGMRAPRTGERSAEIFHQHERRLLAVDGGIKKEAAIGRHVERMNGGRVGGGKASQFPALLAGELVEAKGNVAIVAVALEIVETGGGGPIGGPVGIVFGRDDLLFGAAGGRDAPDRPFPAVEDGLAIGGFLGVVIAPVGGELLPLLAIGARLPDLGHRDDLFVSAK